MKIFFSILLILLPVACVSSADYSKIDKQSATIPVSLKTVPEITAHLTRNLSTSEEKVRAIYYWISHNIRYDVSQLKNIDISYSYGERNLLNEVLQNRQGVCQHYAELFQACCQAAGIQSYIIKGYNRVGSGFTRCPPTPPGIRLTYQGGFY